MTADVSYAFEIALHARPDGLGAGPPYEDAWGRWATLAVSPEALNTPFAVDFDEALRRLGELERLFVEPDGALLWRAAAVDGVWQVDGNAWERDRRVVRIDLSGTCPAPAFDRLLAACGWPGQAVMVQLLRPAVVLDEPTFRNHAIARARGLSGEALRPG